VTPITATAAPTTAGNYHLRPTSPVIDAGSNYSVTVATDRDGNLRRVNIPAIADTGVGTAPIVDMGAYETYLGGILYVDEDAAGTPHNGLSWSTAYTNVQAALDWTNTHGEADYEIWVAEGVYYPDEGVGHTNNRCAETFRIAWNNVQLYGGFAGDETARAQRDWTVHPTILSGDIDANDWNTDTNAIAETWADLVGNNAYHVLWLDGATNAPITEATVLDGFIVTAGNASGEDWDAYGGGLYCDGSGLGRECSPTLNNLTFSGNAATGYAGGMFGNGRDRGKSNPHLTNVTFRGNAAISGGGMFNSASYNGESSPTLLNVTFRGNQAEYFCGGMSNSARGSTTIPNTGGVSNPTLVNVVFSGNQAQRGGGLCNDGDWDGYSAPTLINVTFSGNAASTEGGGILNTQYAGYCHPTLVNAILWGNMAPAGPQIANVNNTVTTLIYTDIQGGATGAGNLNVDPQFVTPITATAAPTTAGNYHLRPTSPVINMGNNLSVTVATDRDGNPRVFDDVVDMGAYESQFVNTAPTLNIPDASMPVNTTRMLELRDYAADAEDPVADLTFAVLSISTASLDATLAGDGHTLNLTPATDWTGVATVTVRVTDTGGLTADDMFVVTVVGGSNTTPTLSIPNISMTVNATRALELRDYASDEEDPVTALTFAVVSVSTASLDATLAGDGHTLNLTPATDWTGVATVTVWVTDSGGLSANDMFNVQVSDSNYLIYLPLVLRTWPQLPETPTLQAIVNDDGDGTYRVEWIAANHAISHELQEAADAAFSAPAPVYNGAAMFWDASEKPVGVYYYRVRGWNEYGSGPWSDVRSVPVNPPTVFNTTGDAYVAEGEPQENFGASYVIKAGYDTGNPPEQIVRSLIRFDSLTIPTSVVIEKAVLQVYYSDFSGSGNQSYRVTAHAVPSEWAENTITWNTAPLPGQESGFVELTTSSTSSGAYYSLDVTSLVQGWVNGTLPNYGIMLCGPETAGTAAFEFGSNNTTGHAPYLQITYGQ
ncbi:MAG: DNRLRE domain-containing protein, partial [Anaerolineae bacterium]|nr:DNRLRE domain-containing protein [Anaerolineae bacterium]